MPFVLDASVPACWAFEDEQHPIADLTLTRIRTDQAHVPALWWFEVRNVLVVSERRKRLAEISTGVFLRTLASLSISIDREPQEDAVLAFARRHKLSVYDAAYLELALRRLVPLATLDTALARAAREERVPLVGE